MECILETKASTILEFFAGLRGTLSVTFEEGHQPPGYTIYSDCMWLGGVQSKEERSAQTGQ